MPVALLVAASLVVFAAVPSRAAAGTVPLAPTASFAGAGVLLAGQDSAWVTAGEGPLTIHVSPPDGPATTLFSLPTPPRHARFVEGFAATPTRIAVVHRLAEPMPEGHGLWSPRPSELLVGTPQGDFRVLSNPTRDGYQCSPLGVGADGDVLVVTQLNCEGAEVVVRDLANGGEPQPLPWRTGPGTRLDYDADVRVAGRFVAWHVRGDPPDPMSPIPSRLVVFDRSAGEVAYEVRLDEFMGARPPATFELNFELQDDGTVVAAVPDYDAGVFAPRRTLIWASPSDPTAHVIPVQAASLEFALHGDLVALRRADTRDYAVIDLAGRPINVFDYHATTGGGVDFDGRRLAWVQNDAVHNEAFPVVATPDIANRALLVRRDGRVEVPVWCPSSASPCRVTVGITELRAPRSGRASVARTRAIRRVTLAPRRTTRVRLGLSRAVRRRLAARRTVRARAFVRTSRATPRTADVVLRRSGRRR